jgi:predicted small lipoprotein YifL
MKRVIVILLVSVLAVSLAACAAHGDLWFGADSAPVSHGPGCGVPLVTTVLATAVSLLLTAGMLVPRSGPRRPLRLPVSFFQPPEIFA